MANPIVFTGLTLDQANATALYYSQHGGSVQVTADGAGTFTVEVSPSAGTGSGGSNGSATGTGSGAQGSSDEIAWGKKVSADFKEAIGVYAGFRAIFEVAKHMEADVARMERQQAFQEVVHGETDLRGVDLLVEINRHKDRGSARFAQLRCVSWIRKKGNIAGTGFGK